MSSPEATETAEAEAEAAPPVDERREALAARLQQALGDGYVAHHIRPGDDLWVRVERDAWKAAALAVRDELEFRFFDWLSVVDWLPSPYGRDMDAEQDWQVHGKPHKEAPALEHGTTGGETRMQMLARFHSVDEHIGFTLKADLPDDDLQVDTLIEVYPGANWHEREAWEMFGVHFVGHPDLRNIYLPGGFEGNPLRKDYPLLARRVKPWPGIVDVELLPGEDQPGEEE